MQSFQISKSQFRKFLIYYHGLSTARRFSGLNGIVDYVKQVGCIQYDPLNVVGRNADLVLQSRIDRYSPVMLHQLLYRDKKLVDGWDKMMSIFSIADWPNFSRLRAHKKLAYENFSRRRKEIELANYSAAVCAAIAQRGPSFARDIKLGTIDRGGWGHSKLSSLMMDYLFHSGVLAIADKKNVQKQYDLIENVFPADLLKSVETFAGDEAFFQWYVKRRIGSIGIYWSKSGDGWLGNFISKRPIRTRAIEQLLADEQIVEIGVENIDETFFVRKIDFSQLIDIDNVSENSAARFIAPLDNIMWDRKLIEKIFNYKYKWEVYKPVNQRQYGYYVLPVLYGDRFVARFEPLHHKKGEPLAIKNWWWEADVVVTAEMLEAINAAFKKFAAYLQADIDEFTLNKMLLAGIN